MRTVAVVPAAGSAERFGGKKLLTPIDGEPLLDRTISALLNGGVDQIIVVVAPDADDLRRDVNAFSDPRVADGEPRSITGDVLVAPGRHGRGRG